MGAPVTHVEIMGPDRAELVRFYGEAFGWLFEAMDEMNYTVFRTASGGIGGGIGTPPDGKASVSVYAEVASLADTMLQAQSLGSEDQMGPVDLGGGARIATIQDPAGNVVGLYEGPHGTPPGSAPPEGAGSPVVWFDIVGPNAEALLEFYRELFDWKADIGSDGYAHVETGTDGIRGGIWTPLPGLPEKGIIVYVQSANLEESLKIIERAGGTTFQARQTVGEGLDVAFFTDPAGNLNGLVQWAGKN
jgi:predicted enzyme related to lactoylglutathione lyase